MSSEEAVTTVKQLLDEIRDLKESAGKETEPLFDLIVRLYQIASEIRKLSLEDLQIDNYTTPAYHKFGYSFNSFFLSYDISTVAENNYLIKFEIYQSIENKEKIRTPNLFRNKYETITYYTWKRICYTDAIVETKKPNFTSALSTKDNTMRINSNDIANIQYLIDIIFKEANSYLEWSKEEWKNIKKNLEELYQHVNEKLKDS